MFRTKKISIKGIKSIEFKDISMDNELITMEAWEIKEIIYSKDGQEYYIENCDGLYFSAKEIKFTK
ncbi:hypothetical protein G9F71_008405 [Clostridium sp. FP2]|uniref:hypothetical protein n=1 Tax=Clostridium sp. FP2 TaxID=2724481 RepID=UPI0013E9673B|nr:hypothetical protein [Clostridium sp. FP2]MBZ9622873.1 hypothetical protein [Clostridium sp. FP2]